MRRRFPLIAALTASGGLMFGENDEAFRRVRACSLQRGIVGRCCLLQDNDLATDRAVAQTAADLLGIKRRRHL
jgi:hypothetical protein